MNSLKILYVHGMEGNNNGLKATALKKEFTVHSDNQHVTIFKPYLKNSPIRHLISSQIIPMIASISAIYYGVKNNTQWYSKYLYSIVAMYGISLFIFRRKLIRNAIKTSFEKCISIQQKAILSFNPDLVIASSWGGAVTMELIKRGIYFGPTILLAPGYLAVTKILNCLDSSLPNEKLTDIFKNNQIKLNNYNVAKPNKKWLIIHPNTDEAINVKDSELLVQCNKDYFNLMITYDNDNHSLEKFTNSGALCNTVKQYMQDQ